MKNIKILIVAAAALFALSSCYEKREFTPETGSTPVEFVSTTVPLQSEYTDIPVHQLAESSNYSEVTLEVLSCTDVHLSGETLTLEDGTDFIFTSKELYVVPIGDEGAGSSSFEVRIPGYADYQRVDINVRLTGPSTDVETTVTLQGVTRYNMEGLWSWDSWGGNIAIYQDEEDYNLFHIDLGVGTLIPATRAVNVLRIDNTFEFTLQGYTCRFVLSEDGSNPTASSPVELTFSDDNNFTATGYYLAAYANGSLAGYFDRNGAGTGTRVQQ